MKIRLSIAFVLAAIIAICFYVYSSINKDQEISDLKEDKRISDSLHVYKDERLKNYLNVTLIQDSIIEVNSFTKRLKDNHKPLLDYSGKL